ncbi:hypothetical protein DFH07DRAFT_971917 [Mycena maculata]|uniref:RING-type domain-containing protein n=1 Tax=Mycena maculata TaxID=230809 RepID=A0AAD7HJZ2_9AGAR|nr:hypothetical protein DFH07DRAFT_971917 [Mycena maculata]
MSALKGSSKENPWVMDPAGKLVLLGNERRGRRVKCVPLASVARRPNIRYGPPSTVIQVPPQPPSISAPGPARTETSIRGARRAAVSVQAPLIPRVSGALVHSGEAVGGERREGRPFLLRADLYLDDIRPPLIEDVKPYHECGLCFNRKSHPVSTSYKCGHSHCFVCIRVWLESQWTCPTCSTVMDGCPFRHWGEEVALRAAYPEVDLSRVSYSWDGLVFPRVPQM